MSDFLEDFAMARKDSTSDEELFNGQDIIIWDPLICPLSSPLENEPIDIGIIPNLTSCDGSTTDVIDSPQKKHKKHKHKKHKKRKPEESESSVDLSLEEIDSSKSLLRHGGKLKIKLPKDEKGDKSKDKSSARSGEKSGAIPKSIQTGVSSKNIQSGVMAKNLQKKKKGKGKDSGTSSEEERWLDAIESGKLEEVDDELKKIKPKDPKLMTARQRAMFERKTDKDPSPGGEQLLALPSGYKEKVMTAEALQKAALKSQKRKQLADEKREKDMKKIMEKILKKQDSKTGKSKLRSVRTQEPRVTLKINNSGVTISMPPGVDFPLEYSKKPNYGLNNIVRCGVLGCTNIKKYTCTSTGIPLCSLACYRKNMEVALLESVLC